MPPTQALLLLLLLRGVQVGRCCAGPVEQGRHTGLCGARRQQAGGHEDAVRAHIVGLAGSGSYEDVKVEIDVGRRQPVLWHDSMGVGILRDRGIGREIHPWPPELFH
jgi:hypothetical protein